MNTDRDTSTPIAGQPTDGLAPTASTAHRRQRTVVPADTQLAALLELLNGVPREAPRAAATPAHSATEAGQRTAPATPVLGAALREYLAGARRLAPGEGPGVAALGSRWSDLFPATVLRCPSRGRMHCATSTLCAPDRGRPGSAKIPPSGVSSE